MSFNHYYQSELTALRQLGRRFAERSPALAPFLGQAGRDPDVERLLEGFAFLTGRLRQKLDDELPELSHSLMHLLWPNYMRPLPAFSILQFDPLKRLGPALMVERDMPVESLPVCLTMPMQGSRGDTFMKNKNPRPLIIKLSIAVGFIGLEMGTNLFFNAFMMLVDDDNFIPKESSIFSFEPYRVNQGSSNYWIYGEDGENYYHFSYETTAPYAFISKSNSCPKFDRQDHTTWCTAEKGEGK